MKKIIFLMFNALLCISAMASGAPTEKQSLAPKMIETPKKEVPFGEHKQKMLKYVSLRIKNLTEEKACIEKSTNYTDFEECKNLVKENFIKTAKELNSEKKVNPDPKLK